MSRRLQIVVSGLSLLLAGALLADVPAVLGVEWAAVTAVFGRMRVGALLALVALWLLGLVAYARVLTMCLPGLTVAQALTVNAASSAVSNLLPFGGAAGVGVTYAMARSWGHRGRDIAASVLVSGVWNTLARFLLPAVGIAALLSTGRLPDRRLTIAAVAAIAVLLGIVLVLIAVLRWESAARRVAGGLDRLGARAPGPLRPAARRAGSALLDVRHATADLVRRRWRGLSGGMAAYLGAQCLLLWGCLFAAGAVTGIGETVAAFSLNRVLTTVVITPSGAGISEAGTAMLLTHVGVPPAPVAAAVLLYAFFTFAVEVPAGGVGWAVWALAARWRRPVPRRIPGPRAARGAGRVTCPASGAASGAAAGSGVTPDPRGTAARTPRREAAAQGERRPGEGAD